MDIDIVSEDENPMLYRSDVTFELVHDEATPSRLSVRDSLAAKLNKDSSEVVVRRLDTTFGMRKTLGSARVYQSPDYAREIEQPHMLQRNKIDASGAGDATDGTADAGTENGAPDDAAAEDDADEEAAADEATDDDADEEEAA